MRDPVSGRRSAVHRWPRRGARRPGPVGGEQVVPLLILTCGRDVPVPLDGVPEIFGRAPEPKRMFVLRRADHEHFADDVEASPEALRAMTLPGEAAWMTAAMLPISQLCPGEHGHTFARGLSLAHLDAVPAREPRGRAVPGRHRERTGLPGLILIVTPGDVPLASSGPRSAAEHCQPPGLPGAWPTPHICWNAPSGTGRWTAAAARDRTTGSGRLQGGRGRSGLARRTADIASVAVAGGDAG